MQVCTVGWGSSGGRQDSPHVGPVFEVSTMRDAVVTRSVSMTPLQTDRGGRGAVQPLVNSFQFNHLKIVM